MLDEQRDLWRKRKGEGAGGVHPLCWAASGDLGNTVHKDRDGWRSFAAWMSRHGHASKSERWWLLFPEHGVAVQLMHGAWASWHGKCAAHCSGVPDVAPGDCLMSLFCSLPADAMGVLERGAGFRAELGKRSTPGVGVPAGRAFFETLQVGMRVTYRFVPPPPAGMGKRALRDWGKGNARWVQATVKARSDVHVVLRDVASPHGNTTFEVREAANRIVVE